MINFDQAPVADLGREPARKHVRTTVMGEDGKPEIRIERVPSGRFFKVVKVCGAVERVPLHTARSLSSRDDAYSRDKEVNKPLVGQIPYGQCPQTLPFEITHGHLPLKWFGADQPIIPPHIRGRAPCHLSINGGPINAANPCKCIEELIVYRKEWQRQRMAKVEIATAATMQSEASRATMEAVKGMAEVVRDMRNDRSAAAAAAAPTPEPPKGKREDR